MKKTLTAATVALALATTANAGNMAEPIMEIEMIEPQVASSSNELAGALPIFIMLMLVGLATTN